VVKFDNARFLRGERLEKSEFKKVFSEGRRFCNGVLTVYILKGEERKAGFVVRRTVHSAVKRNHLKRLLREIFRRNRDKCCGKALIVIVAGKEADGLHFSELESSFLQLLNKAGVIE
jgi:ribonuclease P protein component